MFLNNTAKTIDLFKIYKEEFDVQVDNTFLYVRTIIEDKNDIKSKNILKEMKYTRKHSFTSQ